MLWEKWTSMRPSQQEDLTKKVVDELARVVSEAEDAKVLLLRAGFPEEHIPAFRRPSSFWHLAVSEARKGRVIGGWQPIVEEAAILYPGNAVFRMCWQWMRDNSTTIREVIDFSMERERHKHFFGREDVLAEMEAWVQERDDGWLLITGSPGLGKSALMNHWLRRRDVAGLHTAFHFIRRGHLDWAEPQVVQRNLAAQLEAIFPDFRDPEADPKYRLEQLLGRVSPALVKRDLRLVVLVDGLDEAMTHGASSNDNPIPKIFPLELPHRVFVVTASRPRYPHLTWLEQRTGMFQKIVLDERINSNDRAVREYWGFRGPTMTPPLTEDLMDAAVRGAEGNLLHAVKLYELWTRSDACRLATTIPRGFPAMVDELWQRLAELPRASRKLVREGLALVCAARESLPLRVIEMLLGWEEDEARDEFLPVTREMLLEERWGPTITYRPFHESLRELVEQRLADRRGDTIREYHRILTTYAAWPVEDDVFRRGYALRHRVAHLVHAGEVDLAAKACMDLGYLGAKACSEGVHAVERDIQLALRLRTADEVQQRLITLGRLVAGSAHWAEELPQELPALMHDRALTNAPEIYREMFEPVAPVWNRPKLRHALQIRGMPRVLRGHQLRVTALATTPDGRIVSGSDDNTLCIWDADTGRLLATLRGHEGAINTLATLPDGRVVSSSADRTFCIWDVKNGRATATFHIYQKIKALAVLKNGRLVCGSTDGTLRIWDPQEEKLLTTLEGHKGAVNLLASLPDGRILSASSDKTLRVWDIHKSRSTEIHHSNKEIRALTVLSERHVVFGSKDSTLHLVDISKPGVVDTFHGHQDCVAALSALSEDCFVSGSTDKTLRIWSVHRRLLATLQGHQKAISALTVLPDGRIVSGSADGTLRVWDEVQVRHDLGGERGHTDSVRSLLVSSDHHVISCSDEVIRRWDVQTARSVTLPHRHRDAVKVLALLSKGRAVSGSADRALHVWDVRSGRFHFPLHGHQGSILAVAATMDGRILSGSADETVRVWDAEVGRSIATLYGHQGWVTTLAVLPDGRVVSGSSDRTLRIWDIKAGKTISVLSGHTDWVLALATLPDGRIISGAGDKTLRVWDVQTGQALTTLEGHQHDVKGLAVLPDGCVVSCSTDKTLRVWDLQAERIVATVYGDASFTSVTCVDQHLVVAGDGIGNVWFIDLPILYSKVH